MFVQWYSDSKSGRIFLANHPTMLCEFPNVASLEKMNTSLLKLGIRRRSKWVKLDWGYEAQLRKK